MICCGPAGRSGRCDAAPLTDDQQPKDRSCDRPRRGGLRRGLGAGVPAQAQPGPHRPPLRRRLEDPALGGPDPGGRVPGLRPLPRDLALRESPGSQAHRAGGLRRHHGDRAGAQAPSGPRGRPPLGLHPRSDPARHADGGKPARLPDMEGAAALEPERSRGPASAGAGCRRRGREPGESAGEKRRMAGGGIPGRRFGQTRAAGTRAARARTHRSARTLRRPLRRQARDRGAAFRLPCGPAPGGRGGHPRGPACADGAFFRRPGERARQRLLDPAGGIGRPAGAGPGHAGCSRAARVAERADRAGDRRGGLHRRRIVPPDRPFRSGQAGHAGAQ
ncbi:MAG: hypothetical protein KatS3mg123_2964 [Burkholderiales bacterium]|nr:MAG: hypothetical protein KatS3mg123_2964 [Burkholderiales bacterium]